MILEITKFSTSKLRRIKEKEQKESPVVNGTFCDHRQSSCIIPRGTGYLHAERLFGCRKHKRSRKVSGALQKKFDTLLQWLKEKGWSGYLSEIAGLQLDLPQDELMKELIRKLDGFPSKVGGFNGSCCRN